MTVATTIREDVLTAGVGLGLKMDAALPLQTTKLARFWGMLGGHQVSESIVVPTEADDFFQRMWLVRKPAAEREDSPISLIADVVSVDLVRDTQASQIAYGREIVATWEHNRRMDLYEPLGTPVEDTLASIEKLGGYVTQIAQAKLYAELKKAPSHPNDLGVLGF